MVEQPNPAENEENKKKISPPKDLGGDGFISRQDKSGNGFEEKGEPLPKITSEALKLLDTFVRKTSGRIAHALGSFDGFLLTDEEGYLAEGEKKQSVAGSNREKSDEQQVAAASVFGLLFSGLLADDGEAKEDSGRVTYENKIATIIEERGERKVLLYQPARINDEFPTGNPKENLKMEEWERLNVKPVSVNEPVEAEYYRNKQTGQLIRLDGPMYFFNPPELVVAEKTDLTTAKPEAPNPVRRVDKTERRSSFEINVGNEKLTYDQTTLQVRKYADGVEIAIPMEPHRSLPNGTEFVSSRDLRLFSPDGGATQIGLVRSSNGQFYVSRTQPDLQPAGTPKAKLNLTVAETPGDANGDGRSAFTDKGLIDREMIRLIHDAVNQVPDSDAVRLGLDKLIVDARFRDPLYRESTYAHRSADDPLKLIAYRQNGQDAPLEVGRESAVGGGGKVTYEYSIYCNNYADAQKAAEIIDQQLAAKGLALPSTVKTGTVSDGHRLAGANRVSISRNKWAYTEAGDSTDAVEFRWGASLESDLGEQVRRQYGNDGQITQGDLDRLCRDAKIPQGQLTLDRNGELMFVGDNKRGDSILEDSSKPSGDQAYINEKPTLNPRVKQGRHALYAVYEWLNREGTPQSRDPAAYALAAERGDPKPNQPVETEFVAFLGEAEERESTGEPPAKKEITQEEALALIEKSPKLEAETRTNYANKLKDGYLTPAAVETLLSDAMDPVVRENLFDPLLDPKKVDYKANKNSFAELLKVPQQKLLSLVEKYSLGDMKSIFGAMDTGLLRVGGVENLASMQSKTERATCINEINRVLGNKAGFLSETNLRRVLELPEQKCREAFLPGGSFEKAVQSGRLDMRAVSDILEYTERAIAEQQSVRNVFAYAKLNKNTLETMLLLDSPGARGTLEALLGREGVTGELIDKIITNNGMEKISADVASAYYRSLAFETCTPDQLSRIQELEQSKREAYNKLLLDQNSVARADRLTSQTIELLLTKNSSADVLEKYRLGLLPPSDKQAATLSDDLLNVILKTDAASQGVYQKLIGHLDRPTLEKLLQRKPPAAALAHYLNALEKKVMDVGALNKILDMPDGRRFLYEEVILPAECAEQRVLSDSNFKKLLDSELSREATSGYWMAAKEGKLKEELLSKVLDQEIACKQKAGELLGNAQISVEQLVDLINSDNPTAQVEKYGQLAKDVSDANLKVKNVESTADAIRESISKSGGKPITRLAAFEMATTMQLTGVTEVTPQSVTSVQAQLEAINAVRSEFKLAPGGVREPLSIIAVKESLGVRDYAAVKEMIVTADRLAAVIPSKNVPRSTALSMAMIMHECGFTLEPESEESTSINTNNRDMALLLLDEAEALTRIRECSPQLSFKEAHEAAKLLKNINPNEMRILAKEIMIKGGTSGESTASLLATYADRKAKAGKDHHERTHWGQIRDAAKAYNAVGKGIIAVLDTEARHPRMCREVAAAMTVSEIASVRDQNNLERLIKVVDGAADDPRADIEQVRRLQRKVTEGLLVRYINNLAPDAVDRRSADILLGGLSAEERARAIEYLRSREGLLSDAGMRSRFITLRDRLFAMRGYVSESTTAPGMQHGNKANVIKAYCLTTEGESLAYEFRKETGYAVEIIRPGDSIEPGTKIVLFDAPTAAAQSDPIGLQTDIGKTTLSGSRAQIDQLIRDGSLYVPDVTTDYSGGLNRDDIATLKVNPDRAVGKLRQAIKATSDPHAPTVAVSDAEYAQLNAATNKSVLERRQEMQQSGQEYLNEVAPSDVRRTMLETAISATNDQIITNERMMQQAKRLHEKLMAGRQLPADRALPADVLFVAINREGRMEKWADSAHLSMQIYRQANGLTDKKYDSHFLSPKEAKERIAQAKKSGVQLTVIAINDNIGGGEEAMSILDRMHDMSRETKVKVVYGTFMGHQDGISPAQAKYGDQCIVTGDEPMGSFDESARRKLLRLGNFTDGPQRNLGSSSGEFAAKERLHVDILNRLRQTRHKDHVRYATLVVHPHAYSNSTSKPADTLLGALAWPRAKSEVEVREELPEIERLKISDTKNVGRVNERLLRGGRPGSQAAINELKEMGVKVIIDMTLENNPAEKQWCEQAGIEYVHKPLKVAGVTQEEIDGAVREVQERLKSGETTFVHCMHGRDRTGVVVANIRTAQGWTVEAAKGEMNAYGAMRQFREELGELIHEPQSQSTDTAPPQDGMVKPAPTDQKIEEPKRVEPETNQRRSRNNHEGKSREELMADSLTLEIEYSHLSRRTAQGRQGLGSARSQDLFESRVRGQMVHGFSDAIDVRANEMTSFVQNFVSSNEALRNDPLVKGAKVVADPALEHGGKLVIKHEGVEIVPIARNATQAFVRNTDGTVREIPLAELEVSLHVSQKSLEAAGNKSAASRRAAHEVFSSLYYDLHELQQSNGRAERAVSQHHAEKIDLLSPNTSHEKIASFMESEHLARQVSADHLEYKLNGRTLVEGQPKPYKTPLSVDLSKPLASELNVPRVVTAMDSNGRLCIYAIDGTHTLREVEASKELVGHAYEKLVESYNQKIEEARQKKDTKEVERLLAEQKRILDEGKRYQAEPQFAANVNRGLGAKIGRFVKGAGGPTVTVLFLMTMALESMHKEEKALEYVDPNIRGL